HAMDHFPQCRRPHERSPLPFSEPALALPERSRCCRELDVLNSPHSIESRLSRPRTDAGSYWCWPPPAILRRSKSLRRRAHPAERERFQKFDHLPTPGGSRSDRSAVPIARRAPWPTFVPLGRRRFPGQNRERPKVLRAPPDHCRDRASPARCRSTNRGFPEASRDKPKPSVTCLSKRWASPGCTKRIRSLTSWLSRKVTK